MRPSSPRHRSHTLRLQGGPMSLQEAGDFEALDYANDAMALRRLDEAAKDGSRNVTRVRDVPGGAAQRNEAFLSDQHAVTSPGCTVASDGIRSILGPTGIGEAGA